MVRIGVCSDIHIDYEPQRNNCQAAVPHPLQRLHSFLEEMSRQDVAGIALLGDFCTDFKTPNGQLALELWHSWSKDKVAVVGNHDFQHQTKHDFMQAMNLPNRFFSYTVAGVKLIALDSSSRTEPVWQGADEPDQEQIDWLADELAHSTEYCVLMLHGGVWPVLQDVIDKANQDCGFTKVIAYLYGHSHRTSAEKVNGVWYINVNSTSYRWIGAGADRTYWYAAPFPYALLSIDTATGKLTMKGNGVPNNWASSYCDYEEIHEPDEETYQVTID